MKPKKSSENSLPYFPMFSYLAKWKNSIVADGEIIVVNFSGLGGACKGLEAALGRPPTYAINHSYTALNLHTRNMPDTIHLQQDVWQVDPHALAAGRRIAAAWFSPDCKHFSKAKGGKPLDQNIRDLAWVTLNYTRLPDHLKPRVIFLENVEEFRKWGPLDRQTQKPIKRLAGKTFQRFVRKIRECGYEVEYRVLSACDYGAPTTRKRLFLIARCDGQQIVWPQPTHGNPNSQVVKEGRLSPWRTAGECIEWSVPCPSIFEPSRKLVENTMRRIARGLKRYVIEAERPYLAPQGSAVSSAFLTNKQFDAPSRPLDLPMSTITTNHNKQELVSALLVKSGHYSNKTGAGSHFRGQGLNWPISTIVASGNNPMLTVAPLMSAGWIAKHRTGSIGSALDEPMHTITAGGGKPGRMATGNPMSLVAASLVKHYGGFYQGSGSDLNQPIGTVTAVDHHALLTAQLVPTLPATLNLAHLIHFYGMKKPTEVRGQGLDMPLKTQTTENRHGLVLSPCRPSGSQDVGRGHDVYELMRRYAPEGLTERDHAERLVFVQVDGQEYFIPDIGMRMLIPRELARGQSFSDSYELEYGADGQPISKTEQIKGLGNAVCPVMAEHLARANLVLTPLLEAAD